MKDVKKPRIAVTLGDVGGIGPEILVKSWADLNEICRPIVIGDCAVLEREAATYSGSPSVVAVGADGFDAQVGGEDASQPIGCVQATAVDALDAPRGIPSAIAGQAAYDFLIRGIDLALSKKVDAIVTLPLNKEGLHAAGLDYPGHTEILAEKTQTASFAMMLYRRGLGVVHATLHMALRDVFARITRSRVLETIELADRAMSRLQTRPVRVAVAALNPHAGDGGLFGDEEAKIIAPAVADARAQGIDAVGPIPADTLFYRASQGEFDAVAAMYHDQGHIALKLLGWKEAVNVTVGLPIIRTSVAHGTGYDIVGTGSANPASLLEAVKVAATLCARNENPRH